MSIGEHVVYGLVGPKCKKYSFVCYTALCHYKKQYVHIHMSIKAQI